MRTMHLATAVFLTGCLLAGCVSDVSPTAESLSPQQSPVAGGTQAAPTRVPGSTPLPWWGTTIPLQFPDRQLAGKPADLAISLDGTLYLADVKNHAIVHLDSEGNLLGQWGAFSGTDQTPPAPVGTFNEPWGIALAPDGTVYVADTWNHRIQSFTPDGQFKNAWGQFGQGAGPSDLYGPRDVVVGRDGLIYVSDTGNKRIVAYTPDGEYVSQVGGEGDQLGQFVEPVGIAFSDAGELYVADVGNRRVQVLTVTEAGGMEPKVAWPVNAWPHNDMLYKPYLCVDGGRVFITDTELGSVLDYTTAGELRATYDLNSTGDLNYGLVYGIAAQADGALWVSDIAGGAPVLVKIIPLP